MYKILNGQVAVPAELIDLELSVRTSRGDYNQQKLYKPRTHTTEYQKSFVHGTIRQSQSGILFLHQLLSPTQYLPSSVGSPLFRRAQPPVAKIASGDYYPDPDPEVRDSDDRQNLKISSVAHVPLSMKFCENRLSSFCVILLTNGLTNERTN